MFLMEMLEQQFRYNSFVYNYKKPVITDIEYIVL